MPRSNVGRREADSRPSVSMTAAIDAANMIAIVERETAEMSAQWAKIMEAININGKHIGDYYEAARKAKL